jgi:ribosomal protein S27AE
MYSFSLPILEWQKRKMSKQRRCPKCDIALVHLDPKETLDYFVGDIRLQATVYVPKATCGRCGYEWEDSEARVIRNQGLNKTIDDFWRDKFKHYAGDPEINRMKAAVKTALDRVGSERRRQVAEALVHWLGDLNF